MENNHPLTGVTVIDLGTFYNGPYAGFLMAQAGARVIKVEPPGGETLRTRGSLDKPAFPLVQFNAGKEGVTLNLKKERGKEILKSLVKRADVLIENYSFGTMDALGLPASTLLGVNPKLVYAAGSAFGRSGPNRHQKGMDLTIQAVSGIMSTTGEENGNPMRAGTVICDILAGTHLFGAIMIALFQQRLTGKGAVVDVAMLDTMFPTLGTVLGTYYQTGQVPPRRGNRHVGLNRAPYNVYRTCDGFVSLLCAQEAHWQGLVRAMGREELSDDPRFEDNAARCRNLDLLDDVVESWTSSLTRDAVVEHAQSEGVPCAPVRDIEEVLNDPHLHARGMLKRIEHPLLGEMVLGGSPLHIEGMEISNPRVNPELGADNERVYGEMLDLSKADVEILKAQGVI